MEGTDAQLRAYDVIEAAARAESLPAAVEAVRADLEVLPREDLLRIAVAITIETARILTPRVDRPRFLERVQRRRLHVMVGPL